jgi:hypothetical protein
VLERVQRRPRPAAHAGLHVHVGHVVRVPLILSKSSKTYTKSEEKNLSLHMMILT